MRRAAKRAPNANRSSGPKLSAALAPVKYRPRTDDSKFAESAGTPGVLLKIRQHNLLENSNPTLGCVSP